MYIPAELELLIATQKSCKGLGSEAEAREDAKAKRATVTRKRAPFIIFEVISIL
jgi:hypothetical protein